jgi:hypothetical protein
LRRPIESAQYTSAAYAARADECEVTLSVGRTGHCWDNALASWRDWTADTLRCRLHAMHGSFAGGGLVGLVSAGQWVT